MTTEEFDRIHQVGLWLVQRVGLMPAQIDVLKVHQAVARGALVIIRCQANANPTVEIREAA